MSILVESYCDSAINVKAMYRPAAQYPVHWTIYTTPADAGWIYQVTVDGIVLQSISGTLSPALTAFDHQPLPMSEGAGLFSSYLEDANNVVFKFMVGPSCAIQVPYLGWGDYPEGHPSITSWLEYHYLVSYIRFKAG